MWKMQHRAIPCHAAMPKRPASSWGTASELVALEAVPGGSDPIQVEVVPGRLALHLLHAAWSYYDNMWSNVIRCDQMWKVILHDLTMSIHELWRFRSASTKSRNANMDRGRIKNRNKKIKSYPLSNQKFKNVKHQSAWVEGSPLVCLSLLMPLAARDYRLSIDLFFCDYYCGSLWYIQHVFNIYLISIQDLFKISSISI